MFLGISPKGIKKREFGDFPKSKGIDLGMYNYLANIMKAGDLCEKERLQRKGGKASTFKM